MIHLHNQLYKPNERFAPLERDYTLCRALCSLHTMGGGITETAFGRLVVYSSLLFNEDVDTYTGPEEEIAILRNAMQAFQDKRHLNLTSAFLVSLGIPEEEATKVVHRAPRNAFEYHNYCKDLLAAALLAKETGTPFMEIVATI